jgi:hypothetical protein
MADTELPKRGEVDGDAPTDRMMRLVLSLRAELYDLYAKHQALLDENNRLRATNVLTIKLKEDKDALPPAAAREDEPVLGREREDGTEALDLPTTEDACRAADAGIVSGDEIGANAVSVVERALTPMPNTPKFRPMSPSEHGLAECPPNVESTNP